MSRKQSEKYETPFQENSNTPDSDSDDVSLDLPSMRSEQKTPKPKPKSEVIACNLRIDTTM